MGFYIETDRHNNKAAWLVANAKGVIVPKAKPDHDNIPVVVVNNGPFEAAAICYDDNELAAFQRPEDHRPKTIVMVPRAEIIRLAPHVEKLLNW